VENNSPWDGLREIFATDPYFKREMPAGSCPFHLDKKGYLHEISRKFEARGRGTALQEKSEIRRI
jgi:hypothetical protein